MFARQPARLQASQQARLHTVLLAAIVIAVIALLYDLFGLIYAPTLGTWVSFGLDLLLIAGFSLILWLIDHGHLRAGAWATCLLMCIYAPINTILWPAVVFTSAILPMVGVLMALSYLESDDLRAQSWLAWLTIIAVLIISRLVPPFAGEPLPGIAPIDLLVFALLMGLLLLALNQFYAHLNENLAMTHAANAALEEVRTTLEQTVAERTADLQAALAEVEARVVAQAALLAQSERQHEALRTLSAPVLPVSETALVIPMVGELDADRLRILQSRALEAVERSRVRTLLLDITGVSLIDKEVARGMVEIVRATALLGTETILVGVRPEVAQAVVALGLDLGGLRSAPSLREGLAMGLRR